MYKLLSSVMIILSMVSCGTNNLAYVISKEKNNMPQCVYSNFQISQKVFPTKGECINSNDYLNELNFWKYHGNFYQLISDKKAFCYEYLFGQSITKDFIVFKNEYECNEDIRHKMAKIKLVEDRVLIKKAEKSKIIKIEKYFNEHKELIEYKESVIDGKIKIGMTQDLVVLSWGEPSRKNKTISKYSTEEQWVYGRSYVYLKNGIVTLIQTSN